MTQNQPQTKQVAIIGAGIAGCTTAYVLATQGIKVTLLERESRIASAASGNPLGMLYPRLSGDNIESDFALAAYQHAIHFYQLLGLNHNTFKQCGMLQLGFNARELARIQKVSSTLDTRIGQLVSPTQASAIAGIDCQHPALHFHQAAWIKPQVVCDRLIKHPNIDCQTRIAIEDITQQGDQFLLNTNQQSKLFDAVVICNANDAAQFNVSSHLTTTPVRGQLTQVNATHNSKRLKSIICSDGYLSPAIDHQHTIGATFQPDDSNTDVTEQDHITNLEKVKVISKPLYDSLKSDVIGGRTALRCASPDRLPMVGELLNAYAVSSSPPRPSAAPAQLPWIKGLYVNIAHGSHGLISAPYSANLIADMILGKPVTSMPAALAHLNPNRFHLRQFGLKKLAKTIACSNT